jgi:hypothetical protein
MNKSVASNNSDMYVCKCINERVCKGDWEKRSGHARKNTKIIINFKISKIREVLIFYFPGCIHVNKRLLMKLRLS